MKKVFTHFLMLLFVVAIATCTGAWAFSETVTEAEGAGVAAQPADKWGKMQLADTSDGAVFFSETPGAALEFDFNGVAIAADLVTCKRGGKVSVFVDGKEVAKIDLFRTSNELHPTRMVLANNLAPGAHKLRLEVLAEKHPKSLGMLVAVDTLRIADASYGSISGVVECYYNVGMPVMRANVEAVGTGRNTSIATEASGEFIVDALAPGSYSLRFGRIGFETQEKADIAVVSGQVLALPKILLEENIGTRPLTYIRYPLGVRPVIVRPGDEFKVEVAAPATATGWQLGLESQWGNAALEVKNAVFNSEAARWTITVTAATAESNLLYGIRMKFSGGEDFQPRAVMVVPAFKDSIRIVHLTDVHVYKMEQLFDTYRQLAAEINLINPDLVVVTGDLTDSSGYTEDRWPESDQYPPMLDLWNSYNVPTFIVPGNHDLSPYNNEDDHLRWNKFFDTTDYSFNDGAYHFTAFDNSFTMISSTKKQPFREDLFPEQLAWIEKDLAENSTAKMRILLYHVPLHNTKSKEKDIAAQYGVKLALYGHLHMNQVDKIKSTTYVQTGAAMDGAYRVLNLNDGKLGEISSRNDGFSAFKVGDLKGESTVSPDGRSVSVKVKNRTSRVFPAATWRAEMPAADDYICTGCTIVARHVNGAKTLVVFTFDIPSKGEAAVNLSVK